MFDEGEVVYGAQGPVAQLVEGEPCDMLRSTRNDQRPALHRQGDALARRAVGEIAECLFQRCLGRAIERIMVDRSAGQPRQSIIAAAGKLEHVELLLQQVAEGKKALSVQP